MQFVGGIRHGESYFMGGYTSWPFCKLIIEPDQLTITADAFSSKLFRFEKSQLTKLSKANGFFSMGIRVEHSVKDLSPYIVFWTFKPEAVKAALVKYGYNFS